MESPMDMQQHCAMRHYGLYGATYGKMYDPRGKIILKICFLKLQSAMGCGSIEEALTRYQSILAELGMDAPIMKNVSDLEVLTESVNPARLRIIR